MYLLPSYQSSSVNRRQNIDPQKKIVWILNFHNPQLRAFLGAGIFSCYKIILFPLKLLTVIVVCVFFPANKSYKLNDAEKFVSLQT